MEGKKKSFYFIKSIEWTLVFSLVLIVTLVLLEVFFRYVLKLSLKGIEEICRLAFVWACFIGISYCTVRKRQIEVNALPNKLPPRVLGWINFFKQVIICVVSLVMVIVGWQFVVSTWRYPDYTTTLLYPRSLFWLPIPVSGLIILINAVKTLVLQVRYLRYSTLALDQKRRGK